MVCLIEKSKELRTRLTAGRAGPGQEAREGNEYASRDTANLALAVKPLGERRTAMDSAESTNRLVDKNDAQTEWIVLMTDVDERSSLQRPAVRLTLRAVSPQEGAMQHPENGLAPHSGYGRWPSPTECVLGAGWTMRDPTRRRPRRSCRRGTRLKREA